MHSVPTGLPLLSDFQANQYINFLFAYCLPHIQAMIHYYTTKGDVNK